MRRTLAALAAAVALTGAMAGCGLLGDDEAAPATEPPTTEPTTTTVPPATEPVLLDPGAEPRTELRMALTEGTETTVAVTTDLAITQTGTDGRRQRLDSPPVTQWLTYVVTDTGPDGATVDLEVAAAFADAEGTGLDPEAVADLDEALAAVVGLTGTATVTDRGQMEEVALRAPDDLPSAVAEQVDAIEAQVAAMGPPLPTEAVGVGARWEATASSTRQGAVIATTTTYTVTAIADGAVSYEATVEVTAEPQDLAVDGLDADTTVRLVASSGSGTASGTQRLDDLGLELTSRTELDQQLELTDQDGTRTLDQAVTTAVSVRTPDP